MVLVRLRVQGHLKLDLPEREEQWGGGTLRLKIKPKKEEKY